MASIDNVDRATFSVVECVYTQNRSGVKALIE